MSGEIAEVYDWIIDVLAEELVRHPSMDQLLSELVSGAGYEVTPDSLPFTRVESARRLLVQRISARAHALNLENTGKMRNKFVAAA